MFISILLACVALGVDIENLSHEEALKRSSEIKDEISVDLTDDNFEDLTQAATGATTGDWFVYFYQPTSQKCSDFTPVWRMVAKEAKEEQLGVNIAKIDGSKNPETIARFRINSFPSLLYFNKGKYYNYTGSKDELEILKTIKEGSYTQYNKKRVPGPRTFFTDAMKYARWLVFRVPREHPIYFAAGGGGIILLVVAVCLIVSKEENTQITEPEKGKKDK